RPTPTPRPDGAIVHIVQPGDTLFGIALQYDVPMEQIQQLNAGSIGPSNLIHVGQELVIAIPAATPAPSTPPPPPTAEATATPETGSVCVLAYHDRNGDTFRQADTEEMLPNAVFSLGDTSGLLGQYTTDGLSEPYCFTGLAPGTYRVAMQPPPGYVISGPSDMALALGTAGTLEVAFGAQRGEEAPGEEESPGVIQPEPGAGGEEEAGSVWPQVWRWAARISGILVLTLAAVVAVLFVLSRRRR
ncbi:MAG TPA: LysM peptidoglycan-binding domain-containing protein, partial [Anaerolineae bacterium]|nr:LysM peptidoglycan-binding domain-containing protein [Anaerolineae bacterium]